MRSAVVLASLATALALAAPDAAAQSALPASVQPTWSRAAAPLPASLVPVVREADAPVAKVDARSPWTYPRYGLIAGALAGAVAGTVVMASVDEWMAPPAHVLTVPAGAVAGLALGGVANLVDQP